MPMHQQVEKCKLAMTSEHYLLANWCNLNLKHVDTPLAYTILSLNFKILQKIRSSLQILILSLVFLQHLASGHAYRVLAAFFFPAKSHFMMANSIVRELVKRGHEVTFITPFSLADENLGPNYKEIVIDQYQSWAISK